jgi:uncharacterized protein
MHFKSGVLIHSPHDLIAFLDGAFASWMDRLYLMRDQLPNIYKLPWDGLAIEELLPDERTEDIELIADRGRAHEAAYVAALKSQNDDLVEILRDDNAVERTLAEMKAGRRKLYQGCLHVVPMLGYPDFLVRVAGTSLLGEWHYEPSDAKLALAAKPAFIVQVCAYCDMLEAIQSRRPEYCSFVLGDKREARFVVDEFFFYYGRLKKSYLLFQDGFDASRPPDPGDDRAHGRWSAVASKILESQDHLCRVARITFPQIKKLCASGITTLTALATAKVEAIPRIQPDSLERLKAQARLQLASKGKEQPIVEIAKPRQDDPRRGLALLPSPSPTDIFFDMEGFPLAEGGLEYLFGAVVLENDRPAFMDWWAHDEIQERKAFEGFIDWAYARWKADKSLHIYHYAVYETAALRRLMGKYASREREVDDLLRNQVFVDLYTVVRQGLVIGSSGYSLKDIECLYMPKRKGAVVTASGSVVAYQHWLDSGQPQDWRASTILNEIRDYNEVDCESLLQLAIWLRSVQQKAGIQYLPTASTKEKKDEDGTAQERPSSVLCRQMLDEIGGGQIRDADRKRVAELLAWLLEFHWREAKPVWWRMFDRHEMTEQELYDDFDCLAGLDRTKRAPERVGASNIYEYSFDADQDTKLHDGSKCYLAHDLGQRTEIVSIDPDEGQVTIKVSAKKPSPPARVSLIPDEFVSADVIAKAVYRFVEPWRRGEVISQAIDDLVFRRAPRIKGHGGGPIIDPKRELIAELIDVVGRLDQTTLCIQGPPGSGKTYAIGNVIAQLLKEGKRVGITANSHKAILNALKAVCEACAAGQVTARLVKVGDDCDDPLVKGGHIAKIESADIVAELATNGVVVGGTAWAFSRPELAQRLDYLFIDEAGQFCLANVVGVGLSAKNLVLVGDQMQLSQPIQGSHPGESGQSGLEYLLNGRQTIPAEFGVFLNETRRLHPDVCRFISDAVYEGRLAPHPSTSARRIVHPDKPAHVVRGTGLQYLPVEHDGNTQCSDEEVEVIAEIVAELLSAQLEQGDERRPMTLSDILLVAPYNMQVRRIEQRIGPGARVGSVDRFQGQEAPVVVVSMCTSALEDCPRGAEFLLNRNRLNVAISRAKCLAIVVGSPRIMASRCQTIEQMRLVNLYCRIADYADSLNCRVS